MEYELMSFTGGGLKINNSFPTMLLASFIWAYGGGIDEFNLFRFTMRQAQLSSRMQILGNDE